MSYPKHSKLLYSVAWLALIALGMQLGSCARSTNEVEIEYTETDREALLGIWGTVETTVSYAHAMLCDDVDPEPLLDACSKANNDESLWACGQLIDEEGKFGFSQAQCDALPSVSDLKKVDGPLFRLLLGGTPELQDKNNELSKPIEPTQNEQPEAPPADPRVVVVLALVIFLAITLFVAITLLNSAFLFFKTFLAQLHVAFKTGDWSPSSILINDENIDYWDCTSGLLMSVTKRTCNCRAYNINQELIGYKTSCVIKKDDSGNFSCDEYSCDYRYRSSN